MSVEPAWKRAGLKRASTATETYDPLAAGLKRSADRGPIKPPKRIKQPKSERSPGPVPDQLVYLRQYSENREEWKFSKQKQNWILKNLFDISSDYNDAIIKYVEGIQGGSRTRVLEAAEKIVDNWNEFMTAPEDEEAPQNSSLSGKDADVNRADTPSRNSGIKKHLTPPHEGTSAEKSVAESNPEEVVDTNDDVTDGDSTSVGKDHKASGILKNTAASTDASKPLPPSETAARRAQALIELIGGKKPELKYLK